MDISSMEKAHSNRFLSCCTIVAHWSVDMLFGMVRPCTVKAKIKVKLSQWSLFHYVMSFCRCWLQFLQVRTICTEALLLSKISAYLFTIMFPAFGQRYPVWLRTHFIELHAQVRIVSISDDVIYKLVDMERSHLTFVSSRVLQVRFHGNVAIKPEFAKTEIAGLSNCQNKLPSTELSSALCANIVAEEPCLG